MHIVVLLLQQCITLPFWQLAELAEELTTLPEALHSGFPDLAVDWLHTVFKDSTKEPINR